MACKRSSRGDQAELLRAIRALCSPPHGGHLWQQPQPHTGAGLGSGRQIILAIFEKRRGPNHDVSLSFGGLLGSDGKDADAASHYYSERGADYYVKDQPNNEHEGQWVGPGDWSG